MRVGKRGIGMLEVLISGTIMAIILSGVMVVMKNAGKANRRSNVADQLVSLRRTVRERTDCVKTLTGAACTAGTYFHLKDKWGNTLAGNASYGFDKLGEFNLRASCDGTKMFVEQARLASSTTFQPDGPDKWEPLYPTGDMGCMNFFNPTAPPGSMCTPPNPQGVVLCTRYVTCPVTYYPPPSNTWGCFVGCAPNEVPASCGFDAGAAYTFGGHYSYPKVQGGMSGCLCDVGGITGCSNGQSAPCSSTCSALCTSIE